MQLRDFRGSKLDAGGHGASTVSIQLAYAGIQIQKTTGDIGQVNSPIGFIFKFVQTADAAAIT